MKSFGKELSIFAILLLVCVVTGFQNSNFYSQANILNTTRLMGIYGIFSIGMGFVIITGGIDLSVGSVFALIGVGLSILMVDYHMNPWLACLLAIGAGTLLGLVHGTLITRAKMQPFIVTLCGLMIYRSLARFITSDNTRGFSQAPQGAVLKEFVNGDLLGLPIPVWVLLAISAVTFVCLHRTVYGVRLYATGQNEESARYAGINTKWMITSSYIVCGMLAGVASIMFAYYTNSVSPSSHGQGYELYAIAAAVLGGFSLRGGEGSIIGVLLATALLQVLRNVINILHIPQQLEFVLMGTVILVGVWVDSALRNRKKRIVA